MTTAPNTRSEENGALETIVPPLTTDGAGSASQASTV